MPPLTTPCGKPNKQKCITKIILYFIEFLESLSVLWNLDLNFQFKKALTTIIKEVPYMDGLKANAQELQSLKGRVIMAVQTRA